MGHAVTFVVLVERRDPEHSFALPVDEPPTAGLLERLAGGELFPAGGLLVTSDLGTFVEVFRVEPVVSPVEVPDAA